MNIKQELETLKSEKDKSAQEKAVLEKELEMKKEEAVQKICDEYSHKMLSSEQKLLYNVGKLEDYARKVVNYSYFAIDDIREVLASLVSVYETKEYCYQSPVYIKTRKGLPTMLENDIRHPEIIIEKEFMQTDYYMDDNPSFESLKANGKMIVLYDGVQSISGYSFYKLQKDGLGVEPTLFANGKYGYILDFIDEVISYKMEHKIECITKEQLEALKERFLLSRREEIEALYQKRDAEDEARTRIELNARKNARQYQLKKLFGNNDKK